MLPFPKEGPCPGAETLAAYLGGALADAERGTVELHLASCEECLDALLAAHAARPGEISERTVRKIEGLVAPRRIIPRRFPRRQAGSPWGWVAALAAAVFMAIVAAVALRPRPAEPGPVAKPPEPAPRLEPEAPPPPAPEVREPERREDPQPPPPRPEPPPPPPPERREPKVAVEERKPQPEKPRPEPPPRTTVEKALALDRVEGEVRWGERAARKGDRLTLAQPLRTAFARHGRVEAGGAVFVLHHQTELALGPGPAARIASGRVFVKSAPQLRLETPAGAVTPIGTEFSVEVAGDETWVAVREGAVLFETPHGKATVRKDQVVRALKGRAPAAPARLANPAAYFDWADKAGDDRYVMLYPGARKAAGIVVAAPHAPYVSHSSEIAAGIAERLEAPCVVGWGYARAGDYDWVHLPGTTAEEKAAFAEYARLVREASAGAPARLLVQIMGMGGPATGLRDEAAIEVATSGFTKEDCQRMKDAFAAVLRKHKPEAEVKMVFDLTDARYETGGREISFRTGAGSLRRSGIFRSEHAARGLHVTLPWMCRSNARTREAYEAILAEWIEGLTRP